jgi:DNA-binding HxlR family transcriptional regulator
VLSHELKALAEFGLIQRKDYGTVPPKVEYRLTPVARSFVPVINAIRKWGERHLSGTQLTVAGDATRHGKTKSSQ